jgi:hypothetical protein
VSSSRTKRVLLGLLAILATQTAVVRSQDRPRVEYLNRRSFTIPYDGRDPENRTNELRLYASRNGGPWEVASTIRPSERSFDFRTDQDGNYTFAVQRIYDGGEYDVSTRNLKPQLNIIIDSQQPRATTFQPYVDTDGAAAVRWAISDENLDSNSIQLEYRWDKNDSWLPYDIRAKYPASGSHAWLLKPGQKFQVRIRARDLAKNEYVSPGVWTPPQPGEENRIESAREPMGLGTSGQNNSNDPAPLNNAARSSMFYINSLKVNLVHDVKVGPSGLSRLELYTISNTSNQWKLDEKGTIDFTKQPAAAQPAQGVVSSQTLRFDAPAEGQYGFIIIAKSRAGLGESAPRSGDAPRVQVTVDTSKPKVRIIDIKARPNGDRGGAILEILWEASDPNMAPQPIDIEYASNVEGPNWKMIADKLDNSGRFTWAVPSGEDYQFFVRIKARDKATNVGMAITDRPVVVDLTVPSVDIKDVTPGDK